jgi:NDP-sugar pyrophosphorylase family protein
VKAVVLAAGLGTRLGVLTEQTPKPALEIGGRPLVEHVVAHVARCGYREVAVNLHHRSEQVRAALATADRLGVAVTFFPEQELLGTAGALGQMGEFLAGEEAFLVHYGDVLTDHDIGGMLRRHRSRGALLTLLVHQRQGSNSVVEVEGDAVVGFLERPSPADRENVDSPWVNSGIYVCSAELLDLLPPPPCDVAQDVIPLALSRGGVFVERLTGFRCAVDSPERLDEASRALAEGRWRSPLD